MVVIMVMSGLPVPNEYLLNLSKKFMRTIGFISSVLILLCFSLAHAQEKQVVVKKIRQEFNIINKDKTMKKKVLNNEDFLDHMPDGGGRLTGFYIKGEVKKIVCWTGLSFGTENVEYYFKDNKLIFVYEQFNSFLVDQKTRNLKYGATERTFEGRYYFDNNVLIDKVIRGKKMGEDGSIDRGKSLQKKAKEFRQVLIDSRNGGK